MIIDILPCLVRNSGELLEPASCATVGRSLSLSPLSPWPSFDSTPLQFYIKTIRSCKYSVHSVATFLYNYTPGNKFQGNVIPLPHTYYCMNVLPSLGPSQVGSGKKSPIILFFYSHVLNPLFLKCSPLFLNLMSLRNAATITKPELELLVSIAIVWLKENQLYIL